MGEKKDEKKDETPKKPSRSGAGLRPSIFTQFKLDKGMNVPGIAPGDIPPGLEDTLPPHVLALLRKTGRGPF